MLVVIQAVVYHVFFADPFSTAPAATKLVLAYVISNLVTVLKVTN